MFSDHHATPELTNRGGAYSTLCLMTEVCQPWNFSEIVCLPRCYWKFILRLFAVVNCVISRCIVMSLITGIFNTPHCIILTGGTWECHTLRVVWVGVLFSLSLPSLSCLSLSFFLAKPCSHFTIFPSSQFDNHSERCLHHTRSDGVTL